MALIAIPNSCIESDYFQWSKDNKYDMQSWDKGNHILKCDVGIVSNRLQAESVLREMQR